MKLRRIVPPAIRKRIIGRRRERRRHKFFAERIDKLRELKGRFDSWGHDWITLRNEDAREQAKRHLAEMHKIIVGLASNNHTRELAEALEKLKIPGALRAVREAKSRRR